MRQLQDHSRHVTLSDFITNIQTKNTLLKVSEGGERKGGREGGRESEREREREREREKEET